MPETTENRTKREFIFFGFRTDARSMILTLQSLAIIALFGWCISLTSNVNKNAKESIEEANRRNDQQVQLILSILRPDIVEMKQKINSTTENIDTALQEIKKQQK